MCYNLAADSFYSARNARIASAVLATAIPSVCPSVCPSVRPDQNAYRRLVFWTTSTMKDEKSAAKFHYIKTASGKVVAHSIAFRVVSIYWQGDDPFPMKSCLQVTCPLLSMGDVRTRNSRTDRRRIFKLRGGVDHVTRHV